MKKVSIGDSMKKILTITLLSVICSSLIGCDSKGLTEDEILQAQKEKSKISDMSKSVNALNSTIYDFINNDIKENDCYLKELELENMEYEIKKSRESYDSINFDLIEKYCNYLEDSDDKDNTDYDINVIRIMKSEFKNIIDSYEKMVELGRDKSYSNSDYDNIDLYNSDIIESVYKINLSGKEFEEFFKFYASFAYDINNKTLSEIEQNIKSSGYKYEYEKTDGEGEGTKLLKSMIVYDTNSNDSITFQGYLNDSAEFDLILVQYNIDTIGSTVDMSSHKALGLGDDVSYGAYNRETNEKPKFDSIDEQYTYFKDITNNKQN